METWLDGVTLHVEDVERSLDYYSRLPGAQLVAHRPGEFAALRLGLVYLGLLKFGEAGGFHLEIGTSNLEELHELLSKREYGPVDLPETRPWGERTFNVLDPDGNAVEFSGD
jgi:catechol 2,3-dioxygenase-like lactoylglutathione lyase family enzyme